MYPAIPFWKANGGKYKYRDLKHEIDIIESLSKKIKKSLELLKEYRSSSITHSVSGHVDIEKYDIKK